MKKIQESVIEFSKTQLYQKGFYAGDGQGFWLKCDELQTALDTGLRFIFFVLNDTNITCYKA